MGPPGNEPGGADDNQPVDGDGHQPIWQFEQAAHRLIRLELLWIPIAAVAAVDLVTGAVIGDRRIDIALLILVAMSVWGSLSYYVFAKRLKRSELPKRVSPVMLARSMLGLLVPAFASAAIGYLVGGWIGAALLLGGVVTVTVVVTAYYIRQRRCTP